MTEHLDFDRLASEAANLISLCRERNITFASAESCTGGLVAALLTEVPGSSAVVDRGFVTYSNQAKSQMLGVSTELIDAHGAVSEAVALAMVDGALANSSADIAIAVTGIAGPDGGTDEKPVGLVHIAAGRGNGQRIHSRNVFENRGRRYIRLASVETAFDMARRLIA